MGQHEVDIFKAHFIKAFVQTELDILWGEEMGPDFGNHKDLGSGDPRFSDCSSDFLVHLAQISQNGDSQ